MSWRRFAVYDPRGNAFGYLSHEGDGDPARHPLEDAGYTVEEIVAPQQADIDHQTGLSAEFDADFAGMKGRHRATLAARMRPVGRPAKVR